MLRGQNQYGYCIGKKWIARLNDSWILEFYIHKETLWDWWSRNNLEQKFIFQIGTLNPHVIKKRFSFN